MARIVVVLGHRKHNNDEHKSNNEVFDRKVLLSQQERLIVGSIFELIIIVSPKFSNFKLRTNDCHFGIVMCRQTLTLKKYEFH